jgi:phage/plasmid primase-like uncharacterized protein
VNAFNSDPRKAYVHVLRLLGVHEPLREGDRAELRRHANRQERKAADTDARISKIVAASTAIEGTAADDYLQSRGIRPPFPATLRYYPALWTSGANGNAIKSAAMVAKVSNADGHIRALHRTFLTADGKKNPEVDSVKKMLGPCKGAGVWPDEFGDILAIAEGIETALSFTKLSGVPCVAALAAGFIGALIVPDRVRELIIAADHDENGAGLRAAQAAAHKLWAPWRRVRVLVPDNCGDFNDILRGVSNVG